VQYFSWNQTKTIHISAKADLRLSTLKLEAQRKGISASKQAIANWLLENLPINSKTLSGLRKEK